MSATVRLFAGDCTVVADAGDRAEFRGNVVVLVKPDDTVLVHDARGYQPLAWLTRAEEVFVTSEGTSGHDSASGGDGGLDLRARDGDQTLLVRSHQLHLAGSYPVNTAGTPVGRCPDCDGALVKTRRAVSCLDCERHHGIPTDATLHGGRCECGLPRMRVERGAPLDLCVDRDCESLDEAVVARFDREWDCPECGDDLRIIRRGGLLAGCDAYPDCETGYSFPAGSVVGSCDCGLPVFETAAGRRCLDSTCEAPVGGAGGVSATPGP
ncbi:topoisomerase DNA-binding C4 zinc finger domain-containing protein [Haloarchaeobius sp. TZWWS8]|uniref:topoisomerase DNA-binding C4 zinc finger domain-containing protein n=1 Tax=Haloarchaeobius sp. TZWWS8 TaxID=3446121 RepID=UPI003EB833B1